MVTLGAVSSYLPFSPLPGMGANPIRAVCFLWHFPSGNPWEIPVSRFHGTRCLVMSGLSSTPVRRPEQRPPEPDRHGLHTLSSARGKAQSRHGKNFVSFFLPLPSSSHGRPLPSEQGKAATGLLPWPLQLTTYEKQLDPLILKSSLLLFRGMQPITHMNIRHRPGKSTQFGSAR